LAAIVTFPLDLVLTSLKLNDHQDGPYGTYDDDEGPQELADPSPDVRSIGKREHVNDGDSSNTQANTTVNVPFRISEEHILTVN
jgi:hypothetical protein